MEQKLSKQKEGLQFLCRDLDSAKKRFQSKTPLYRRKRRVVSKAAKATSVVGAEDDSHAAYSLLWRYGGETVHAGTDAVPQVHVAEVDRLLKKYRKHWEGLLEEEWVAQKEEVKERASSATPSALESRGLAELHAQVEHARKENASVVSVWLRKGTLQVSHGDSVLLSRMSTSKRTHKVSFAQAFHGTVQETYTGGRVGMKKQLVVHLNKELLQCEGNWRIDQCANPVTHERMVLCLRLLTEYEVPSSTGALRELIIFQNEFPNQKNVCDPGAQVRDQLEKQLKRLEHLNPSQMEAIRASLIQRVTLVQGPPGTGKTTAAVGLLSAFSRLPLYSGQILATAFSNVAVDNLMQKLVDAGRTVVRVGVSGLPHLQEYDLDRVMEKHKEWNALVGMRASVEHGNKQKNLTVGETRELVQKRKRADALQMRILNEIVDRVDVVCATCVGSAQRSISHRAFAVVLVDESSQCMEPACLIPVLHGASKLILLGDHMQLPPTIISQSSGRGEMLLSLFERLVQRGLQPCLLDTQYRMHPAIVEFPSDHFYSGRIQSHTSVNAIQPAAGVPWLDHSRPLLFLNCFGTEMSTVESSLYNKNEQQIVCQLVGFINKYHNKLGKGEDALDVGVISPYIAQVRALRRALPRSVEVATVDGFQGREKDVIIVSTVRSNKGGTLGFLRDSRRLNVAMTRGRAGMVVVGNEKTLKNDEHWAAWLNWMKARGLTYSADKLCWEVEKRGNMSGQEQKNGKGMEVESSPR